MPWPTKDQIASKKAQAQVVEEPDNRFMGKQVCNSCKHDESMHYEGKDRQCNTSGCRCEAMKYA